MVTETDTPSTYVPSDDDVKVASGGSTWRFASGSICRGSERQGSYETRPKIVGRLVRVGIHEGTIKDTGAFYSQVEADIETKDGLVHCKSSLTDDNGQLKSSIATNGFAWGLIQVKPNELICITTSKGEPTPKGGIPTYVNFARVDEKNIAHPIYKPRRDKNAPTQSVLQQWAEVEPELRKHPAWGERSTADDVDEEGNANTHLSAIGQLATERGWPTPDQAPAEWLQIAAAGFGHPVRATLRDYSDDDWGMVHQVIKELKALPKLLKPAADRLKPQQPAAPAPAPAATGGGFKVAVDEYDPFADE